MRTPALLAIVVLLAAGAAQATTVPDLTAQFITVSYDLGTGFFTAYGDTAKLNLPPVYSTSNTLLKSDLFSIEMYLNADGSLVNGTLTVGGKVPSLPALSGTLLTGNITEFAYTASPGFNVFNLGVTGLGGDLAPYFQPKAEVVLSSFCSSTDVFVPGSSYGSFGLDSADVMGVPEPLTVAGLLLGLSGLGGYLRKRLA